MLAVLVEVIEVIVSGFPIRPFLLLSPCMHPLRYMEVLYPSILEGGAK